MPIHETNLCLATVTTEEFVPGTLVMLYSFLKNNPWFQGDIVIIHDGLTSKYCRYLAMCFERVRFVSITPRLKACLQDLLAHRPDLASRQARFYSLEIFRLAGYDKVLFCDSDLLFCKSVYELFEEEQGLICCGDGSYYRENCRDATSFAEISGTSREATTVLRQTFNAGFLLFDVLLLNKGHYNGLLALLSEKTWQQIETDHTDQVVYNLYFAGQQTLVGCEYNYMLRHQSAIYAKEGVKLTEASVFHFNGPAKPWDSLQSLHSIRKDPFYLIAIKKWNTAYLAFLALLHLNTHHPVILKGKSDASRRLSS